MDILIYDIGDIGRVKIYPIYIEEEDYYPIQIIVYDNEVLDRFKLNFKIMKEIKINLIAYITINTLMTHPFCISIIEAIINKYELENISIVHSIIPLYFNRIRC